MTASASQAAVKQVEADAAAAAASQAAVKQAEAEAAAVATEQAAAEEAEKAAAQAAKEEAKKAAAKEKKREQLKSAFAMFDADGSGAISAKELAAILGTPVKGKPTLTPEQAMREAEAVIAKYDTNGGA